MTPAQLPVYRRASCIVRLAAESLVMLRGVILPAVRTSERIQLLEMHAAMRGTLRC
jgi:hypothetical protein